MASRPLSPKAPSDLHSSFRTHFLQTYTEYLCQTQSQLIKVEAVDVEAYVDGSSPRSCFPSPFTTKHIDPALSTSPSYVLNPNTPPSASSSPYHLTATCFEAHKQVLHGYTDYRASSSETEEESSASPMESQYQPTICVQDECYHADDDEYIDASLADPTSTESDEDLPRHTRRLPSRAVEYLKKCS